MTSDPRRKRLTLWAILLFAVVALLLLSLFSLPALAAGPPAL